MLAVNFCKRGDFLDLFPHTHVKFEAKWREMFEEFGVKDGSSFSITFTYNVKRCLPSEKFNYLQEYNFELSNN